MLMHGQTDTHTPGLPVCLQWMTEYKKVFLYDYEPKGGANILICLMSFVSCVQMFENTQASILKLKIMKQAAL